MLRQFRELKSQAAPALIAAICAALLALLTSRGVQPLSDLFLSWNLRPPPNDVILLVLDSDPTPVTWSRAARIARDHGAEAIGLVGRDLPEIPGVIAWSLDESSPDAHIFAEEPDTTIRRWNPRVDGEPTFPARLLYEAAAPVPILQTRIPLNSDCVPTLTEGQLTSLAPQALDGRIAIIGSTDPWYSPQVFTPFGPLALTEVVARLVADPSITVLNPMDSVVVAALLAAMLAILLIRLQSNARRLLAILLVSAASTGLAIAMMTTGHLVPLEPLLGAVATAALGWGLSTWHSTNLGLARIIDNLATHVGEAFSNTRLHVASDWHVLCQMALIIGAAEQAWAVRRQGRALRVLASTEPGPSPAPGWLNDVLPSASSPPEIVSLENWRDSTDPGAKNTSSQQPEPSAAPRPEASTLHIIPIAHEDQHLGYLLLTTRQEPDSLQALQALASYVAHRHAKSMGAGPDRFQSTRSGLKELESGMEHLLRQRDLLTLSLQDSRTAHAIFDPLGRPLLMDESFRAIMESCRIAETSSLPDIWSALKGSPDGLVKVLAGGRPHRFTVPISGVGLDAWLYSCSQRGLIVALGVELVDISELQAQDSVKSGLLEMVSFRVNNILAAIRGYADLLSMGGVDVDEVAPRIAARCGELAQIFKRYETVARDAACSNLEPVQMMDLVHEVVAGARRTLGEQRVQMLHSPVSMAPALGDRNLLARALMNLLLEMAQAVSDDTPILMELRANPGSVEVHLWTDGPSIPLGMLQQLASDHREQGSSLARQLIQQMGGSFTVSGGGAGGARYGIYLPEA